MKEQFYILPCGLAPEALPVPPDGGNIPFVGHKVILPAAIHWRTHAEAGGGKEDAGFPLRKGG